MDTRKKSSTKFLNEVSKNLSHYESSFELVYVASLVVLTELQALRTFRISSEPNPFTWDEPLHPMTSLPNNDYFHQPLKLSFPKFSIDNPIG